MTESQSEEEFVKEWDNQLKPIIHDDGRGMTVCFHVEHPETETGVALHMEAYWPEVGMPSYDPDALAALIENTFQEFAHIVWSDRVPSVAQLHGESKDD